MKTTSISLAAKIEIAAALGAQAFADGASGIPACDKNLIALLAGIKVGEAEPLIRAWTQGFIDAPLPEESPSGPSSPMTTLQTEACITAIAGPRVKPNPEQAALMHRARNYGNYVCDTKECLTATYLVALGWLAWSEARPRQIEITAAGSAILG